MKNLKFKIGALLLALFVTVGFYACKKSYLDVAPVGSYQQSTLANTLGVNGLLIGAYSLLDGEGGAGGGWQSAGDNWVYGGVVGGDAHKGSDPGDQNDIVPLESHNPLPSNSYLEAKWQWGYDGIQRSNEVLRVMRVATGINPADTVRISGEARFLRGHYHFELKRMFNNVPYVDESITYQNGNFNVPNTADIWPHIEADFTYAMTNLPAKQTDLGRANKYAAEAYLAKVYMYEHKYAQAKPLFDDLIANGVNSRGVKYLITPLFHDQFNAATKNNSETVFAAQNSVNDGSGAANANDGDVLNFPYGAPVVGCCGFYQPSYSLVNSFKTTAAGLPDIANYNNTNLKNDEGLKSSDPFTPDNTQPLDPRLDWTAGRRGIPYLDWGIYPGFDWIRNQASAGPYAPLKNVTYKSQVGTYTDNTSWTPGYTAININIIRFADVLLMAAEAEVEVGSLDQAETYVNLIRNRAANPAGFLPGSPANYVISPYAPGYFTTQGKDGAKVLVRFERKLELAMEGHRWFDLVRWGTAQTEINAYIAHEVASGYTLIKGAAYTKDYFPIPQNEIDLSHGVLKQNP